MSLHETVYFPLRIRAGANTNTARDIIEDISRYGLDKFEERGRRCLGQIPFAVYKIIGDKEEGECIWAKNSKEALEVSILLIGETREKITIKIFPEDPIQEI